MLCCAAQQVLWMLWRIWNFASLLGCESQSAKFVKYDPLVGLESPCCFGGVFSSDAQRMPYLEGRQTLGGNEGKAVGIPNPDGFALTQSHIGAARSCWRDYSG
jgi:hypothetical protein